MSRLPIKLRRSFAKKFDHWKTARHDIRQYQNQKHDPDSISVELVHAPVVSAPRCINTAPLSLMNSFCARFAAVSRCINTAPLSLMNSFCARFAAVSRCINTAPRHHSTRESFRWNSSILSESVKNSRKIDPSNFWDCLRRSTRNPIWAPASSVTSNTGTSIFVSDYMSTDIIKLLIVKKKHISLSTWLFIPQFYFQFFLLIPKILKYEIDHLSIEFFHNMIFS